MIISYKVKYVSVKEGMILKKVNTLGKLIFKYFNKGKVFIIMWKIIPEIVLNVLIPYNNILKGDFFDSKHLTKVE